MVARRWLCACIWSLAAGCASTEAVDLDGRAVDPLVGAGLTVLVFVSTSCPVSNRSAPEVRRLAERFRPAGVSFYLVYPRAREGAAEIREQLGPAGAPATVLRDPHRRLVARSRVTVTPEAAVFRARRLLYHGRIDDRFVDLGLERPAPLRHDLEAALLAAIAGQPIDPPGGPAVGCTLGDAD